MQPIPMTGEQFDEDELLHDDDAQLTFQWPDIEPFLTTKDAANRLGLSAVKLQRAARAGIFPTYRFQNGRILVRLSEVIAAIEATRQGGSR